MGIFKTAAKIIGIGPSRATIARKEMGMTREQYDQYCAAQKAHYKAIEDEKTIKRILDGIAMNGMGYLDVIKYFGKETVDEIWAKHPEILSSDGTINPVLEQQNVSQNGNNSLKELELKKQILEMELKLQEMKSKTK